MLDRRLQRVRAVLAMASLAAEQGRAGVIVPAENAREAAIVQGIDVIPVARRAKAVGSLADPLDIEPTSVDDDSLFAQAARYEAIFVDMGGQEAVKRAQTVAADDRRNIRMIAPPLSAKP